MRTFNRPWRPVPLAAGRLPPEPVGASIHVWLAQLTGWLPHEAVLAATLSPEERHRAQQFRDPALASRYVIGRGLLRKLLAQYLGAPAGAIEIVAGAYGKPELPVGAGEALLFNAAHSGDVALYGFANGHPLGVDVEAVDQVPPSPLEARRILSDAEWEGWQHLSDQARIPVFYQTWVRKEAVLKALGTGLMIEPGMISVGLTDHPNAVFALGTPVCIRDLQTQTPIKAAVASIGVEMPRVRCYFAEAAG